ncbi:MAG: ABC transporter ATP-binding protein [Cyanobacteriota bacterium]|nr:ABC transporter ATP-binding protein [Cyanobacteriota bacterium]
MARHPSRVTSGPPVAPPQLRVDKLSKCFGAFPALREVSFSLEPGVFHALLGENGAGKSTLVKCIMGFFPPSEGEIYLDGRRQTIHNPREAQRLGLGMVYQHFTAIPALTVAENLVLSGFPLPSVIHWRVERHRLRSFLAAAPFQLDLEARVGELAAGQKQKLEILRQLYLGCRILILDEPTSVLTPAEADEVLGQLQAAAKAKRLSVLMITHKFREVMAFAERVSVLRRGQLVAEGPVSGLSLDALAEQMLGHPPEREAWQRQPRQNAAVVLDIRGLQVERDRGLAAVHGLDLSVGQGEIVGLAGVSGNGQRELVEVMAGQRQASGGSIRIAGQPYSATREQMRRLHISILPEEPLRNASVGALSIADNLALRLFERSPFSLGPWWLRPAALRAHARRLIETFNIRPHQPAAPLSTLSGGNVQRVILARELSPPRVDLLVVANPCFGLDFDASAFIQGQLLAARNRGTAVLLLSEDLDELLTLSDRLLVMSEGRLVYETTPGTADLSLIGRAMAGHGD